MRLSYSTGATYIYPLTWTFKLAADAGFESVELVLNLESLRRGPEETWLLARQYGLAIGSIHGPIVPIPGWPRDATSIDRIVRYGQGMDPAPLVVLHVPKAENMEDDPRGRRYRQALAAWRESCLESPVPLAIETPGLFHSREHKLALFDPGALAAFAEAEGTGLVLDTVHAASLSCDVLETYETLRGRLANVHFSDLANVPRLLDLPSLHSYIKHHQLPGHGVLPLGQLVSTLVRDGYDGLLTLELSPVAVRLWSRRQALRMLRESIDFVEAAKK